jgi:hypothetical protein
MNRLLKIGATLVLAFFAFTTLQAQASKTLKIDSIHVMGPILIGGSTDLEVRVRVTNLLSLPDTVTGDIFYYYQTDSMQNAGAPPRIFLQDSVFETIPDGMLDTVTIDIQPNELRTNPVNLIILWPALIGPETIDSVSDSILVYVNGYASTPTLPAFDNPTVLFPCPALQYIYIRPEELSYIRHIQILTMDGKIIATYNPYEFSHGMINLDALDAGYYMVTLTYDKKTVRTKILKH